MELVVLPVTDIECQRYLHCSRQGKKVFLPREVIPGVTTEFDKVIFEVRPSAPVPVLRAYFQSLRPMSLTATGAPCIAVLLLGYNLGWHLDFWTAFAALVGAIFLQIAVNVLNDIGDHLRLIDLPGTWGGSGVLQNGWLTVRDLRRVAMLAIVFGGALGLFALQDHLQIVGGIVVFIAALGTLGYSGRALQLKYRALGDVAAWLMCGPALTTGFALAAFGSWNAIVVWTGAFFGFLACGILHVNHLQDIPLDSARGGKTLASVLGFRRSRHLFAGYYIAAVLCAIWIGWNLGYSGGFTLIPVVAILPLFWNLISKIYQASGPLAPTLHGLRFDTAKAHLATAVLFSLGQAIFIFL